MFRGRAEGSLLTREFEFVSLKTFRITKKLIGGKLDSVRNTPTFTTLQFVLY